jgi:ketosteroid isomerase-like protein
VSAEENLARSRKGFEAFMRGDLDTVLKTLDPDIEVFVPLDLPNSGKYHGHEGYLEWVRNWMDAWEEYTLEAEEFRAIDDDHVLTVARQSGRGRGSGLEVSGRVYFLGEYRGGKAVRLHLYLDEDSALTAAANGD